MRENMKAGQQVEGRVAIVTGGATGLGRAIANGLAGRGCAVVIADINLEAGEELAGELNGRGYSASVLRIDLAAPKGAESMVEWTLATHGRLDILVNNAGYGQGESFFGMRPESWDMSYALNVRAVAIAMQSAGRAMKERGAGRIINITSPASRMALPNYAAYAATKAALDSLTRAGAVALAPYGVQVNSVAPGMMDTAMQDATERQLARIEGRDDFEVFVAERTRRIPLGRRTDCDEVAQGVIWLALDAPDYVIAERLNLSGGLDRD
jgi:NAD(P)-dependent dehydrogenase (short-subunit alcohol dehydrogenase family)